MMYPILTVFKFVDKKRRCTRKSQGRSETKQRHHSTRNHVELIESCKMPPNSFIKRLGKGTELVTKIPIKVYHI